MKIWITFLCIALIGFMVQGAEIIVSSGQSIQMAIDEAQDGDTIIVEPGLYRENLIIKNKKINLMSRFFETLDEKTIDTTIIDGDFKGVTLTIEQGLTRDYYIGGFTIQNGKNISESSYEAGSLPGFGGGILCKNASPHLSHLKIQHNEARFGGGIAFYDASHDLPSWAGSTRVHRQPYAHDILIRQNSAISRGGGIYALKSQPELYNLTIIKNRVSDYGNENFPHRGGGGIGASADALPMLANSIVQENTPEEIYIESMGDWSGMTLSHNLIKGGEEEILHNYRSFVWSPDYFNEHFIYESSNLSIYEPIGFDGVYKNRDLVKDKGLNRSLQESFHKNFFSHISFLYDLSGQKRVENGVIDLGAYEGVPKKATSFKIQAKVWPNPFTDRLTITIESKEAEVNYEMSLINLNGQKVFSKTQTCFWEKCELTFHIPELPSGTYLIEIKGEDQLVRKKVVKI